MGHFYQPVPFGVAQHHNVSNVSFCQIDPAAGKNSTGIYCDTFDLILESLMPSGDDSTFWFRTSDVTGIFDNCTFQRKAPVPVQ